VVRAVVADPAVVTDSVIAATPIVAEAVMFLTYVVGRIVAAVTSLGDAGHGQRSDDGERQQSLGVASLHNSLPF
jgi:hypothetical protein